MTSRRRTSACLHSRRAALLLTCAATCTLGLASGCASLRRTKITPDSVAQCRQLMRQGVDARERGAVEEAQALLNRAVAASPGDVEARRNLAEVLWQQGACAEASRHIEASLKFDGRHVPTIVRSGEMLLALGQIDEALARAEEAVALDPAYGGAWSLRGRSLRARGELDRALADLQQSLRFNPHDVDTLIETAELQYQLGRPQRCLTTLHHAMEGMVRGEEPRRALWLEGLAYGAVNRREDSVASLAAACGRGAPDPNLLYHLAQAEAAAGRPEAASDTVRQALALDGENKPCQALLAQLQTAGGLEAGGTILR